MKKRVRKKLHLREFAEYGVELELKVTRDMDKDEFERFFDSLIDYVEYNGLFCGGSANLSTKEISLFIEVSKDINKAGEFQAALERWLEDKGFSDGYKTAINDAWYPERRIPVDKYLK